MKPILLYLIMCINLISGTLSTITSKLMNKQSAEGYHFNHPYFQTATMFVGESICLIVYRIYFSLDPTIQSSFIILLPTNKFDTLINKIGKFVYAIPTFFDLVASSLSYLSLIFIAPSVYVMLQNFNIVVVAVFSVVFLKSTLYRHQILGCTLATVGIFIVGLVSVLYQANSASNPVLGAVLGILGQFFTAGMLVVEELFFSKIKINSLYAVGLEGIFGIGYFLILLPVLYFIPCDLDFCIGGRVEDSILAFKQIGSNSVIAGATVSIIFIISFVNWSGISMTKHVNALARSTLQTAKTVILWICSILLGWEVFLWPQLIGFAIMATGTMIYNEVLVIPWLGFKEAVERRRENKEREENVREGLKNGEDRSCSEAKDAAIN